MTARRLFIVAVFAALPVLGCDRSESTPAAPSNPPPGGLPATPKAGVTSEAAPLAGSTPAPAADPTTPSLTEAVKSQAAAAKTNATTAVQEQTAAARTQADAVKSDLAAASSALAADAQKKLDEVMTYIKENKLDLADKTLQTIEQRKAQFSAAFQDKITKARSALDAAKTGGSKLLSLPSFDGSSKQ